MKYTIIALTLMTILGAPRAAEAGQNCSIYSTGGRLLVYQSPWNAPKSFSVNQPKKAADYLRHLKNTHVCNEVSGLTNCSSAHSGNHIVVYMHPTNVMRTFAANEAREANEYLSELANLKICRVFSRVSQEETDADETPVREAALPEENVIAL